MPLNSNLLERMALRANIVPSAYLDILCAWGFKAVSLAVKFGVFDELSAGPQTASTLADKIGTNARATRILLETLEAFGYVKGVDGKFANIPMATKWMLKGSKGSFSDWFRLWRELFEFWSAHEEEALRNGKPQLTLYDWFNQEPRRWRLFHAEEVWAAQWLAVEVVSKLKVPANARKALDVGGGHGMYSVALCRRYPNISSTVFDQPLSLEYAKETIASEKMNGRVLTRPGNFMVDDLGSGYDVAMLFNIIHGFLPEANQELLRRVANALRPGGMLVVFDQLVGGGFGSLTKASTRLWGLTYLILLGGQVYSTDEVRGWLKASGFAGVRQIRLRKAGSSLMVGKKAPE